MEARSLIEWAKSQPKRSGSPIPTESLLRQLKFMSSTLPSKNADEETGKEKVTVYAKLLSHATGDAIVWMVAQACARFEWFPTPRKCLDLLDEYERNRPSSEPERALDDGRRFLEARMADFMEAVKNGDASALTVEGIPDHWRWIAYERGYLRHSPDGGFTIRAQSPA